MHLTPAAAWSANNLMAVAVATMAVAGSFAALLQARQVDRLVAEIEVQTLVAEAYQSRAMHCLDVARGWIEDAEHRQQAQMSLDLSKGITFCLVRARDRARLEVSALAACTREVEAANSVFDLGPDGTSDLRPVC